MAITFIAVVFALIIGHANPDLARLRQFQWFDTWIDFCRHLFGAQSIWQQGLGVALIVFGPALFLGLIQWFMADTWLGFLQLLLGIGVLFYCWGPRDLDLDIQAIQSATDTHKRFYSAQQLADEPPSPPLPLETNVLIDASFFASLRRWFGVLFWFFLLGPAGALLYRLVQRANQIQETRSRFTLSQQTSLARLFLMLDWIPAHLMSFALALAADFDAVASAWRDFHAARGRYFVLDLGFLSAAARSSVRVAETEDEEDLGTTALPTLSRELGFAMALIWRILIVWLLVFALLVLAGWIN